MIVLKQPGQISCPQESSGMMYREKETRDKKKQGGLKARLFYSPRPAPVMCAITLHKNTGSPLRRGRLIIYTTKFLLNPPVTLKRINIRR